MGRNLFDLQTPALILDDAALRRNLGAMSGRASASGVELRPHCKTAKCVEAAQLATEGHSGAITVSTLLEAEFFADGGFTDITYAVGIAPHKLERVAALQDRGVNVTLLTDSADTVRAIVDRRTELGRVFPILIEIDSGDGRAGLAPESDEVTELGQMLSGATPTVLAGVLTHAGHSYKCATVSDIAQVAENERSAVVTAAERLRHAGLECPRVSIGSTPTAVIGTAREGVTEMRPGNYVFFDLMMVALGVCDYEDIAAAVLTTVIGHHRSGNHILTDAGALALSKDVGIEKEGLPYGKYGLLRTLESAKPIDNVAVTNVSQEHGWVSTQDGSPFPFERFPVGTRLLVYPNHTCLTCALYDRHYVVDGAGNIVDEWPRLRGW